MIFSDSKDEWNHIHLEDLWVYNKLYLSRRLGYNCGPSGVTVPYSDFYIIRPVINLMGMGRFSRIEYIRDVTEHYHPGEFWCEVFKGEHISVDFYKKESKLVVRGHRRPENPLWKWDKWEKIDKKVKFPVILENLVGSYDWINCEFIGNRLIEVHFRQNPDFRTGNTVAIPIWDENELLNTNEYNYVRDPDYKRLGFYID